VIANDNPLDGDGDVKALEPGSPRSRTQRIALAISVVTNLSLLGFFKYFNFATENYDALTQAIGLPGLRLDLAMRVTLPLGISFYTFQSMSYTIDVYRGHARALRNFIDFACYVSMFPQLVAGPIIRFSEVSEQLRQRTHTLEKCARGVAFIGLGLAKKILIANACGKLADVAFDAGSIRALLYIPIGGSKKGVLRTYVNLAVVMLLGGLWHGASWNFAIWGGIHGVLLGIERMQGKDSLYHRLPVALRMGITFGIVCISWVFFRAADLPAALAYLGAMFGVVAPTDTAPLLAGLLYQPYYVATFAAAFVITWGAPQTWDWTRSLPWWKVVVITALFGCSILLLATQAYNPFIYFIF